MRTTNRHLCSLGIALATALFSVTLLGLTSALSAPALSGPPPPEDEEGILSWFVSYPGTMNGITATRYVSMSQLALGDWYDSYRATDDFYTGAVTESLADEIVLATWWTAPIFLDGEPLAVIEVVEEPAIPGGWHIIDWGREDLAEGLEILEPADKLFNCVVTGCYFAVRGETAIPLDEYTQIRFPGPVSLADLQQYVLDYESGCEPGQICGGPDSSMSQEGHSGATRVEPLLLLAGIVLAVGATCSVVGSKRRVPGDR